MKGEYILGDCMEYLGGYADNHFDFCLCDPPYGIKASKPAAKPNRAKQKNGSILRIKANNYTHKDWDNEPIPETTLKEIIRVSKNQIIWGINYLPICLQGGRIVWDKVNGGSDQYGCEIAYNSINIRTDIIPYMWAGMMQGKSMKEGRTQQGNKKLNEKRIHPTQKPVALYRWLLQNYAKPNDLILDTHVGSASSLIACEMEGFNYVGFEKDSDYYQQSTKRIKQHLAQKVLF